MELFERLKDKFGEDTPIFTKEIYAVWNDVPRQKVFKLLKELTEKELLCRSYFGVYYIPTDSVLGKSIITPQDIVEKKFVRSNGEVYGYYTGIGAQNMLGMTRQMPFTQQIITENTSRKRRINLGKSRYILYKSRVKITKDNVYALQLLSAFVDNDEPLDNIASSQIKRFVEVTKITLEDIYAIANAFPKKTLQYFISSGAKKLFKQ